MLQSQLTLELPELKTDIESNHMTEETSKNCSEVELMSSDQLIINLISNSPEIVEISSDNDELHDEQVELSSNIEKDYNSNCETINTFNNVSNGRLLKFDETIIEDKDEKEDNIEVKELGLQGILIDDTFDDSSIIEEEFHVNNKEDDQSDINQKEPLEETLIEECNKMEVISSKINFK